MSKRITDSPEDKRKVEIKVFPGSINDGYNSDQPNWTNDNCIRRRNKCLLKEENNDKRSNLILKVNNPSALRGVILYNRAIFVILVFFSYSGVKDCVQCSSCISNADVCKFRFHCIPPGYLSRSARLSNEEPLILLGANIRDL